MNMMRRGVWSCKTYFESAVIMDMIQGLQFIHYYLKLLPNLGDVFDFTEYLDPAKVAIKSEFSAILVSQQRND